MNETVSSGNTAGLQPAKGNRKTVRVVSAIVVIAGIAWVLYALCARYLVNVEHQKLAGPLSAFLEQNHIDAVYAPRALHWLNSSLNGKAVFAEFVAEQGGAYNERVESSGNIGILCDKKEGSEYGAVGAFLRYAGGSARTGGTETFGVYYDFKPPEDVRREIPPGAWLSASDDCGRDLLKTLTDCSMSTVWRGRARKTNFLEIVFKEPVTVSSLRAFSRKSQYPDSWRIQGRGKQDDPWQDLVGEGPVSGLFWSGPRVYFGGIFGRLECRFKPAAVMRLRITIPPPATPESFNIAEIQIFGPDKALFVPEKEALPDLMTFLERGGISDLYCDRWLAGAVGRASDGRIRIPADPAVKGSEEPGQSVAMKLTASTAIVVRREDAGIAKRTLAGCNILVRETDVGPWTVLDFGEGNWRDEYFAVEWVSWNGPVCLVGDSKRLALYYAHWSLKVVNEKGICPEGIKLMERAVAVYPDLRTGIQWLANWHWEKYNIEKATPYRNRAATMWKPAVPAEIMFRSGIEFIGFGLSATTVRPGQNVVVRFYWKCPAETDRRTLNTFVNLTSGNQVVFEDNYRLLEDHNTAYQAEPEVFVEERIAGVPATASAGKYQLRIGLCDRARKNARLSGKTTLPAGSASYLLPVEIEVVPEEQPNRKEVSL